MRLFISWVIAVMVAFVLSAAHYLDDSTRHIWQSPVMMAVIGLYIGVGIGVFAMCLFQVSRNDCTQDCNQGRACTCNGEREKK